MSFFLRLLKRVFPKPKGEFRRKLQKMFMYSCRLFPVNRKKAVFSSYNGTRFNDNPRAIFEEMVRQRPDWQYIWLMSEETATIANAKIVKTGSFDAMFHLATAKLWIDNCRKDYWIVKRKKQYYVQTWHGDVALKKVEKDTENTLSAEYLKCCHADSKMANLFIAGSSWREQNYRKAFWYDGPILMKGMPKSDIYYKEVDPIHRKVCECFGVSNETHLCLYVPTFRNNGNLNCYDIDYHKLLVLLAQKWGGTWIVLVRLHPNLQVEQEALKYDGEVRNASFFDEVNELIVASDLVITDYSSCMFDALEARKRVILYASDLEDYLKERNFYFALEELPFPLAKDNEELSLCVKSFDEKGYLLDCEQTREMLGLCNGPDSSAKVTEYIFREIEGGRKRC